MNGTIEGIRKSIEEIISETDEAQLLLYTVEEDIQMLRKSNARLKAENAKLKELVRDVWEAWQCSEFSMIPKLFDRICELGVEVDG